MSFLASIAGALFKQVVDYLGLWWERKQAEAARWNAAVSEAKLKAEEAATAVEKQSLVTALTQQPLVTKTPSSWLATSGLMLLLLSGCCRQQVPQTTWPVLTVPERQALPEGQATWTARETALIERIEKLEKIIKDYNAAAAVHNRP